VHILAGTLRVAGGGGSEDAAPSTGVAPSVSVPSSGAPVPGGGLSIEDALASTLAGPLMVKGYLVAPEGEESRLCSALLESNPPQCGEPSLAIEGLDHASVEGLARTDDPAVARVTWSNSEISLLGEVHDATLTVSSTSGLES
jgi:hypothetical protein